MNMTNRLADVEVDILHETTKAVMVKNLRGNEVWLPKSQIEIDVNGEVTTITMPEWLATDKELI